MPCLLSSAHLGFALSTTQVCSGSILGSGVGRRLAEVRWTLARRMVFAWALTLPAAAVVGALAASVASSGTLGVALVLAALLAMVALIVSLSHRNRVTEDNVNDPITLPVPAREPAAA